jgi:hypothetical protein
LSDNASANPIEIPAPSAAARPTRNVAQVCRVAKAAANNGARVETERSINPARPGLHDLQQEQTPLGFALLNLDFGRNILRLEFLGSSFVAALLGGEVP